MDWSRRPSMWILDITREGDYGDIRLYCQVSKFLRDLALCSFEVIISRVKSNRSKCSIKAKTTYQLHLCDLSILFDKVGMNILSSSIVQFIMKHIYCQVLINSDFVQIRWSYNLCLRDYRKFKNYINNKIEAYNTWCKRINSNCRSVHWC